VTTEEIVIAGIIALVIIAGVMYLLYEMGRHEDAVQGLKEPQWENIPVADPFAIECMTCDEPLTDDTVHIVEDGELGHVAGEQLAAGEGTSVRGDFCAEHCPGGCQFERNGASA
jgi:hypothetical protein